MKTILMCAFVVITIRFSASAQSTFPFEARVVGQGANKILLLPGIACSGDVWNSTMKQLGDRFECHVLTMPGFAGVKPAAEPDLNRWVQSIEDYIDQRNLGKPIIIGHSLGGIMAMIIAADRPQSVSKIVVVDALPCLAALQNPNFVTTPNPDCDPYIHYLTKLDSAAFAGMQQSAIGALVKNRERAVEVLRWSLESDRRTMANLFCQISSLDLRKRISAISCPALVLLESKFGSLRPAIETQYANLNNATLKYADKGLHFVMYDDEDWYMNELVTFLR